MKGYLSANNVEEMENWIEAQNYQPRRRMAQQAKFRYSATPQHIPLSPSSADVSSGNSSGKSAFGIWTSRQPSKRSKHRAVEKMTGGATTSAGTSEYPWLRVCYDGRDQLHDLTKGL